MNQSKIENGNSVETCLYKNRIEKSVETFKGQMSRKFSTNGKIIGKGDYEFCVVDGKLVQVVPANLHKPLKRVIKTLENAVLDLNPRSKGRINVIKGEGKIESGGKKYQLVELKIDSQWRIFGYQDPNTGKKFVFDKIGRDDNGINNYKASFFKNHVF